MQVKTLVPTVLSGSYFSTLPGNVHVQELTVHIVDLEKEVELVGLIAVDEEVQSFEQLVQTDGSTAIRVEQSKETLSKERLWETKVFVVLLIKTTRKPDNTNQMGNIWTWRSLDFLHQQ